ncbi:hypothetical protein [Microcoleus sp. FACHB-831]|nr:hypothetical protein [Microcoleus sp. FACHB-831]
MTPLWCLKPKRSRHLLVRQAVTGLSPVRHPQGRCRRVDGKRS